MMCRFLPAAYLALYLSSISLYDFMARTYLAVIMLASSGIPVLRTALNVPQLAGHVSRFA